MKMAPLMGLVVRLPSNVWKGIEIQFGSIKVMIGQWMSNEVIEETGCYT